MKKNIKQDLQPIHTATENERTELKILIEEHERLAKTINAPIANFIYALLIDFLIYNIMEIYAIIFEPLVISMLDNTDENNTDNKDDTQKIALLGSILLSMAVPLYYAVKTFYYLNEQLLLYIFPNGFLHSRQKEKYDMNLIENVFTSSQAIQSLIKKARAQNTEMEVSRNQVISYSRLLLVVNTMMSFLEMNEKLTKQINITLSGIALNRMYHDMREGFIQWRKLNAFHRFSEQLVLLSDEHLNLQEAKWQAIDKDQLYSTRFVLTFPRDYKIRISNKKITINTKRILNNYG